MLFLQNKSNLPPVAPGDPPALPTPFADYEPDWPKIENLVSKYRMVENIIFIAQGGSVNTFRGIYHALRQPSSPKVYFIDTNQPEYLQEIRESCNPERTLLLVISKSGETLTSLEAFFYFYDLPHKVAIMSENTPLHQIVRSDAAIDFLIHPAISGRFAGFTEIGMFPSLLCGFDAESLRAALRNDFRGHILSDAWQAANIFWELEQAGKDIVLLATYARSFNGFSPLVQQLLHETIGKNGLGITIIPVESPEFQHHTAQRLFDGRKDISLVLVNAPARSLNISVPAEMQMINLKDKSLKVFDGLDLAQALKAEYAGVQTRAQELAIPNLTIHLERTDALHIGAYIFFWQMVALYSAHLRGLNPFDQPAVEASKIISFKERFK